MHINAMIPIQDVDIVLTFPDDTTETVTLQAPNSSDPFEWGLRRIPILSPFRDGNFTLQKGYEEYQFIARFSYDWHTMSNVWKFLVAETIELRIPPAFTTSPETNYQTFTVFLENDEVLRNWLQGLVMGDDEGVTFDDANPIPAGGLTLNFAGVTPYNATEIADFYWDRQTGVIYEGSVGRSGSTAFIGDTWSLVVDGATAGKQLFGIPAGDPYKVTIQSISFSDYQIYATSVGDALDLIAVLNESVAGELYRQEQLNLPDGSVSCNSGDNHSMTGPTSELVVEGEAGEELHTLGLNVNTPAIFSSCNGQSLVASLRFEFPETALGDVSIGGQVLGETLIFP